MTNKSRKPRTVGGQISNYLVVFVGSVVLEKDNAFAVQPPVVPLSLWGIEVGWEIGQTGRY